MLGVIYSRVTVVVYRFDLLIETAVCNVLSVLVPSLNTACLYKFSPRMVLERVITPQIPPNPLRVIAHGGELTNRLNDVIKRYFQVHVEQLNRKGALA